MPVFTEAPFPLLYGCRMTRAPAAAARAPVASVDPSSMTRTSRHRAAARSWLTISPIASCSSSAGMTIDTVAGSAKQLLHHAVPCHCAGADHARLAEPCRQRAIGPQARDRCRDRHCIGCAHEAVLAVGDELERPTGVAAG